MSRKEYTYLEVLREICVVLKTERGDKKKKSCVYMCMCAFNIMFCSSTNLVKNSSQVCSAQFDLHNYAGDYGAPLEFSKHFVHKGPLDILL